VDEHDNTQIPGCEWRSIHALDAVSKSITSMGLTSRTGDTAGRRTWTRNSNISPLVTAERFRPHEPAIAELRGEDDQEDDFPLEDLPTEMLNVNLLASQPELERPRLTYSTTMLPLMESKHDIGTPSEPSTERSNKNKESMVPPLNPKGFNLEYEEYDAIDNREIDAMTREYMSSLTRIFPTAQEAFARRAKWSLNEVFYYFAQNSIRGIFKDVRQGKIILQDRPKGDNSSDPNGDLDAEPANRLILIDGTIMVNKFDNRKEFLDEMNTIFKKIQVMAKELDAADNREGARIIREYSNKDYELRYGVDLGTILSATLGARKAEQMLLKGQSKATTTTRLA
jgi:hypothetical protein